MRDTGTATSLVKRVTMRRAGADDSASGNANSTVRVLQDAATAHAGGSAVTAFDTAAHHQHAVGARREDAAGTDWPASADGAVTAHMCCNIELRGAVPHHTPRATPTSA